MAPAEDSSSYLGIPTSENSLQPFFILHRGSAPRKPVAKARRKIDLSPKSSNGSAEDGKDDRRLETFNSLWSSTESFIKDAIKGINADLFDEIDKWVHRSFDEIRNLGKPHLKLASRPFPILDYSANTAESAPRQIFTSLLFTKNLDSVDDISTFLDLGVHLRGSGCHVAHLSSLDVSSKNGIGGCLKTLFRQFLTVGVDVPDMSVLASWYSQNVKYESPLVVVIDEVERCCSSVLADFINVLREWSITIPIMLVLGVATTIDFVRGILSSETCLYLSISEFTLGPPAERMDSVVEAVLKAGENFIIGNQVLIFLRDYFLKHDGTLTLFIRALRIAMVQHAYNAPSNSMLTCADMVGDLSEVKKVCNLWSSMFMCLYDVGKHRKTSLLDMYCEILGAGAARDSLKCTEDSIISLQSNQLVCQLKIEGHLTWAYTFIRDLPGAKLANLLKMWEMHTKEVDEIHRKVKELQHLSTMEVNSPKVDTSPASKRLARNGMNKKAGKSTINEKASAFLQMMVRQCVQSIEKMPLSKIPLFNDSDKLQKALIGDPRRRIQADLLESNMFLKCSCCSQNSGGLIPSMHNTSIMYTLAQEHGDLINLHDWFQSFKAITCPPPLKSKKLRTSPSPKRQKTHQRNNKQKRRIDPS